MDRPFIQCGVVESHCRHRGAGRCHRGVICFAIETVIHEANRCGARVNRYLSYLIFTPRMCLFRCRHLPPTVRVRSLDTAPQT